MVFGFPVAGSMVTFFCCDAAVAFLELVCFVEVELLLLLFTEDLFEVADSFVLLLPLFVDVVVLLLLLLLL